MKMEKVCGQLLQQEEKFNMCIYHRIPSPEVCIFCSVYCKWRVELNNK